MNELTLFAGFTIVYTAIAMWIAQPSYACVMPEEPRRRIYLERPAHREHLNRDGYRVLQVATRYAAFGSVDRTALGAADRCVELLTRQLAIHHEISTDSVRAAIADER